MLKLKVYGTGTSNHEYLIHKLEQVLYQAGIPFVLDDVRNIKSFIDDKVYSIPAIKINDGPVRSFNLNGSYHKELRKLIHEILNTCNFGNMKKILVPTDFSPSAENALNYAQQIAQYLNAVVSLLNVYHPSFTEIDGTVYVDEEEIRLREEKMKNYVEALNQDWVGEVMKNPIVEGNVLEGFPAEVILDAVGDNDLVILSAQGENKTFKRIFGSVSTEIALNATKPVIIVPEDYKYKAIKKILVACEDSLTDKLILPELVKFANLYGADIIAVHVEKKASKFNTEDLMNNIKNQSPAGNVDVKVLVGDEVTNTIRDFAKEENIDLICFGRRERGFFYDLFHPSFTKKMAILTDIPLLIINAE